MYILGQQLLPVLALLLQDRWYCTLFVEFLNDDDMACVQQELQTWYFVQNKTK